MSFSERINEFGALIELFIKRQGRIRNIVSIIFSDIIYPIGLYFSLSNLISSQEFNLFLSGLLVLFTTTYVMNSVTAWLGMDKAYNYYPIIRSLGPSILEYSLALIIVIMLTTLPGVIILTVLSYSHLSIILLSLVVILTSSFISGFISALLVMLFSEYTVATTFSSVFSYVISVFPPIFYPVSILPSPWNTVLNYIYTAEAANSLKALLRDDLTAFFSSYYVLLIYLLILILIFIIYLNSKN
ncbi:MAG: hypothetical protein QXL33_07435 [Sulfolobaceae archaeon]